MKQFILIIGMSVIIMIISITLLSMENHSVREDELNRVVATAVKQTVKKSQIENQNEITSDKEMVAHFIHLFSVSMKSVGDISVEVMGVNWKEGMLDVLVTQKFKQLNGKEGSISVRKCAVYE